MANDVEYDLIFEAESVNYGDGVLTQQELGSAFSQIVPTQELITSQNWPQVWLDCTPLYIIYVTFFFFFFTNSWKNN